MHAILINNKGQVARNINVFVLILLVFLFSAASSYLFYLFFKAVIVQSPQQHQDSDMHLLINSHKQQINRLQQNFEDQMDAYIAAIGKVQAKLTMMETIGDKLVKAANLNAKEFDFKKEAAVGGPVNLEPFEVEHRLVEILSELEQYEQQLFAIEAIVDESAYLSMVTPQGKPAEKGWISSYFGKRKDPFTGKKSQHKGLDIAAKSNTSILATAHGVVSWAGRKSGYGQLIELTHGNGLVTRYGHCKSILVKQGDVVSKGDIIGKIGSTGRSTGPHVHYEVLKNGIKINPIAYVKKKAT
jgi:murein DD-endopeptidase MepM/ murein hydrolase activator NlpD